MELFALDRDVRRVALSWRDALAKIENGDDVVSPFEALRHASSRKTVQALVELKPSILDRPLRDALAYWVSHLTVERVLFERTKDLGEALLEKKLILREGDRAEEHSLASASHRLLVRPLRAWRDIGKAIVDRAVQLEGQAQEIEQGRNEAWKQIGIEAVVERHRVADASLRAFAHTLLEKTESLARELLKKRAKAEDQEFDPYLVARDLAQGLRATQGWPQALSSRWMRGLFPHVGNDRGAFRVHEARNGASFLRAFEKFGEAAVSQAKTTMFASEISPFDLERKTMGAVFGMLPARATFLRRTLDLGSDAAIEQARELGIALLFELRNRALVLLAHFGEALHMFTEASREETSALYRVSSALGTQAREKLVGAPFALDFESQLMERFDEDWFKNPRLVTLLRDPVTSGILLRGELEETSATTSASRIAEAFERSLA